MQNLKLWNPLNGHRFRCRCQECMIFWDTWLGEMVYRRFITPQSKPFPPAQVRRSWIRP